MVQLDFDMDFISDYDKAVYYNIASNSGVNILHNYPYTPRHQATITGSPKNIEEFFKNIERYKKRKKILKFLNKKPLIDKIKNIFK